tara:strand:+ start:10480 stop:11445 length:966 start_codon:yes stop_codon:yes gene_type:complete
MKQRYGFLCALLAMVGLAWLMPQGGVYGGWFLSEYTKPLAVMVVFLCQGLSLPTESLKASVKQVRLHVFIQGMLFLVVPLIVGTMLFWWGDYWSIEMQLGLCFMAFLPTTLSACIVFIDQAKGNRAVALFNVTLANSLGVLIPVCVSMILLGELLDDGVLRVLFSRIFILMLLPLGVGQLLRLSLRDWADDNRILLRRVCSSMILFVVYCSFAQSMQDCFAEDDGWDAAFEVFGIVVFLWSTVNIVAWWGTKWMGFKPKDRIAAFFCGTHKTLAAGVPLADAIFSGLSYEVGVILLPILFYHFLEIMSGGIFVTLLQNKKR